MCYIRADLYLDLTCNPRVVDNMDSLSYHLLSSMPLNAVLKPNIYHNHVYCRLTVLAFDLIFVTLAVNVHVTHNIVFNYRVSGDIQEGTKWCCFCKICFAVVDVVRLSVHVHFNLGLSPRDS